jgi:hypothetical protein
MIGDRLHAFDAEALQHANATGVQPFPCHAARRLRLGLQQQDPGAALRTSQGGDAAHGAGTDDGDVRGHLHVGLGE